ncbi:hypothetical protein Peur_027447 [Populus x canadensis]
MVRERDRCGVVVLIGIVYIVVQPWTQCLLSIKKQNMYGVCISGIHFLLLDHVDQRAGVSYCRAPGLTGEARRL